MPEETAAPYASQKRGRLTASLAHGNPGDKGDRVRLKYADTIALKAGVRKVSSPDAYPGRSVATCGSRWR